MDKTFTYRNVILPKKRAYRKKIIANNILAYQTHKMKHNFSRIPIVSPLHY